MIASDCKSEAAGAVLSVDRETRAFCFFRVINSIPFEMRSRSAMALRQTRQNCVKVFLIILYKVLQSLKPS